jgi:hypothetical protein
MSYFKGDYLRVLSPVTIDGMTPKIGADGKVEYKEDHLPVTAQKILEKKNLKLPVHLRKKIEVVPGYVPPAQSKNKKK